MLEKSHSFCISESSLYLSEDIQQLARPAKQQLKSVDCKHRLGRAGQ